MLEQMLPPQKSIAVQRRTQNRRIKDIWARK